MTNKIRATFLALAMAIGLSACASDPSMLPPEALYPTALTTCSTFAPGTPRPDKTKARTDAQKAQLAAGLYDSYMDCKTVVGGWKSRRDLYTKQYETQHYDYLTRVWRSITGADSKD